MYRKGGREGGREGEGGRGREREGGRESHNIHVSMRKTINFHN